MHPQPTLRAARGLAALLVIAAGATLPACSAGHGTYTGEFLEESKSKLASLKAATEWDMARQQFLSGDLDKALKTVDTSIAMDDRVAKSHVLKGRILIEMNRLQTGLEALELALEVDPEYAEAHYYSGIIYERFSRFERALGSFNAAFESNPTEPQYMLAAAEMLIQLDRLDEARAMLLDEARSFEHNPGIRQTLGHIALMEQETMLAVDYFEEACLLAPDDAGLIEDLTRAQIAGGEFAEAEHNLTRLLAKPDHEDRRDLLHLRTRCLIELDRPVEARSLLRRLTSSERGASDIRAWIELANVSLVLDDTRQLRACASRLLAIAPERPEGYMAMAVCQRRDGDSIGALRSLQRADELSDSASGTTLLQAALLLKMGRPDDASRALELVLRQDPADVRAMRLLALATTSAETSRITGADTTDD